MNKYNTWLDFFGKEAAVNITENLTIQCSANVYITIDKMYGPIAAYPVRIILKYDKENDGCWVVEYQNPTTELWEEKARWSCQENWPEK